MGNFVETTREASKGGFAGIKTIRGLVVLVDKVPAPEGWQSEMEQIKVEMEDVSILEMFEGEETFELKEGKFSFYYPYAKPGGKPTNGSAYIKVFVASCEKAGTKPSALVGKVCTFSRIQIDAGYEMLNRETKKKEPVIFKSYFSLVPDQDATSEGTKDYVKTLITGLNKSAALRQLVMDARAKQFPEYKEKLNNGTLAKFLGLTIVEDKFIDPTKTS